MKAGTGEITNENSKSEEELFNHEESLKLFGETPGHEKSLNNKLETETVLSQENLILSNKFNYL